LISLITGDRVLNRRIAWHSKAGEMLARMDKAKNQYAGNNTLPALGITKTQSSRWQRGRRNVGQDGLKARQGTNW
jgi:hypothetical protein